MGRRLLRQGLRRSRSSRNLHKNLHRRNIHQAEEEAEPKRKRKPKRKPNRQNLRRCLPRHRLHRQNLHRTLRRTDLRRQKPTTTRGRQLSWLERRPRLRRDPRSTREPAPLLLRKPPEVPGGVQSQWASRPHPSGAAGPYLGRRVPVPGAERDKIAGTPAAARAGRRSRQQSELQSVGHNGRAAVVTEQTESREEGIRAVIFRKKIIFIISTIITLITIITIIIAISCHHHHQHHHHHHHHYHQ